MSTTTKQLGCLYYPFSRCLDSTTLKYLCLIFDSITFLDEIDDAEWRRKLLRDMARMDNPMFSSFEELSEDYDMLRDTGAIRILPPIDLSESQARQVALATKADLTDPKFISIAQKPQAFGLPARPLGAYHLSPTDKPTWQVFRSKIAYPLLESKDFTNDVEWSSHVIVPGTEHRHWVLSYEAGSAAVTNFYLQAAGELQLTPVTTSQLHHELVLQKLKRAFAEDTSKVHLLDDNERRRFRAVFGQGEIIRMFGDLFPTDKLEKVSFKEIVKFRKETQDLRRSFLNEIDSTLRVIDSDPTGVTYDKEVIEAIQSLKSDFKKFDEELINTRNKVIPAFGKAAMFGTAGGGILSTLVSFLGGLSPVGVIAASALTISGAFLIEAVDLWNEKRKTIRNQSSSVSYLAKVSKIVR